MRRMRLIPRTRSTSRCHVRQRLQLKSKPMVPSPDLSFALCVLAVCCTFCTPVTWTCTHELAAWQHTSKGEQREPVRRYMYTVRNVGLPFLVGKVGGTVLVTIRSCSSFAVGRQRVCIHPRHLADLLPFHYHFNIIVPFFLSSSLIGLPLLTYVSSSLYSSIYYGSFQPIKLSFRERY